MDPNKILLLLKFTKQLYKALKDSNKSDLFDHVYQIKRESGSYLLLSIN